MPLALQVVPLFFLLASWALFMGIFVKHPRYRRYWLISGALGLVITIGLAVAGFQGAIRQP